MVSLWSLPEGSADTWRQRVALYLVGLGAVMLLYAIAYHYTMARFEGASHSFLHSFQVVVETFTTTGFGSDAPWDSPQTNLLVILMDLTGVVLIFLALPVLIFPMFEEVISTTPPSEIDETEDHVVICSHSSRIEALIDELKRRSIPYVVIEGERDQAVELIENGVRTVHGDPTSIETLENVHLSKARALVSDVDDSTDASVVLTAGQVDGDVQLITFVRDPSMAEYHRYAGADHVFSPRQLIGESLANKVTTGVTAEVGDAVEIGEDFEIVELPVQAGSEVDGKRVADSAIRERTGVNVIGAWFRGEFESPPSPDSLIDDRTILLVAGHDHQLESLTDMTLSGERRRRGHVIIGGHGEVGSTVKARMAAEEIPNVSVDIDESPGVDVVGDITEEDVLSAAGIEDASTVILALASDTRTIFGTLVVREIDPDIEIIARADETESVSKLYHAGADYVLALATVSGRMLASTILGEDVISFDQQIEVVRFGAGRLVGETLGGADVRAKTGCTVLAVERDGDVITDLGPGFEFRADDDVIVGGPDENITAFAALYE